MSSDCKTKSPGSGGPASFPGPRGLLYSQKSSRQLPVTNGRPLASQSRKKEEKGRERKIEKRDIKRRSLPALERPRTDTDLKEMSSSRYPALETHSPRPLAPRPPRAPRALAAGGRNRCGGGDTEVARAHLAVAFPPDLLAAAIGARANGVQHLVVLRPSGHGRALRRSPAGRSAGSETPPSHTTYIAAPVSSPV